MLFNSFTFLIFFPAAVALYFIVPKRARAFTLLAESYAFYMGWSPRYALLLLFTTAVTFFAALLVQKSGKSKKRLILALSLCLVFSILFYYKYLGFTLALCTRALSAFGFSLNVPRVDIVLPVGISFFTFQAAGYLIDVWRGEIPAERNFFTYALFVSFFPQLVAGPIERSKSLLVQLKEPKPFDFCRAKSGLFIMLYGYILKMVIADRASLLVDAVYANDAATGVQIAFATFIFAFQIYCDFYGYSTIALGAARVLGIELMQNFDAPYRALSFKDFWRRWHISLSAWFRDYVYIPLGGSRHGRLRKNLNVMAVMLVSGIWHGAGLHFAAWGFLNGLFQVFDDLTQKVRARVPRLVQAAATFCCVCLCWLFFRAPSLTEAFRFVRKILFTLEPGSLLHELPQKYGIGKTELLFLLACIALLFVFDALKTKFPCAGRALFVQRWQVQSAIFVAGVLFVLVFGVWGTGYNPSAFIYFQF